MLTLNQFVVAAGSYFGNQQTLGLLLIAALFGVVAGALPGRWLLAAMVLASIFSLNMDANRALVAVVGVMIAVPFGRLARRQVGPDDGTAEATPETTAGGARAFGVLVLVTWGALAAVVELLPRVTKASMFFNGAIFASLILLGMACAVVRRRDRVLQGLASLALGIALSLVLVDQATGVDVWTFGIPYLKDGVPFTPVLLGLLFVPEVLGYLHPPGGVAADGTVPAPGRSGLVPYVLRLSAGLVMVMFAVVPISGAFAVLSNTYLLHGLFPMYRPNAAEAAKLVAANAAIIWTGLAASVVAAGVALAWRVLRRRNLSLLAPLAGARAAIAAPDEPDGRRAFFRASAIALIVVMVPWAIMGVCQGSRQWGDFVVFVLAAAVGWTFRRHGVPRAPFVVGLIAGDTLSRYVDIIVERYGSIFRALPSAWLFLAVAVGVLVWGINRQFRRASALPESAMSVPRMLGLFGVAGAVVFLSPLLFRGSLWMMMVLPGILFLLYLAVIVGVLVWSIYRQFRRASGPPAGAAPARREETVLFALFGLAGGAFVLSALSFHGGVRDMMLLPGILLLLSCAGLFVLGTQRQTMASAGPAPAVTDESAAPRSGIAAIAGLPETARAWLAYLVWIVGGVALVWAAGFIPAMVLFAIAYCYFAGRLPVRAIVAIVILMTVASLLPLHQLKYALP